MKRKNNNLKTERNKLYIVLVSIHGLIRGHNLELGRDADTGGQIKYVVELARALSDHPDANHVDLLTRKIIDPKIDADYSAPMEEISHGAYIIRLACGPRRYLRKEVLWPHLDSFIDNALQHFRKIGRIPDIIHGHYADAGYVGARLSQLLGIPFIHTGHSLGRVKRQRLLDSGVNENTIENQYNMSQRIEAEEIALGNSALVITSTSQEVKEQYSQYENYHPKRMKIIPPGIDLNDFHPPKRSDTRPAITTEINRFLKSPKKPMILALSRPDIRKNIATLVRAYGENKELREQSNLIIVAGNRDDIRSMDKGSREVLTELLMLIDYYDLYGSVSYFKHHRANDVPDLYRMVFKTRGVFVNPALTEPFGLTLIEASACGAPIVATRDGGPSDIIKHCENGLLINPLDADEMGNALLDALTNKTRWKNWSKNGQRGAKQHYTWDGHVKKYVRELQKIIGINQKKRVTRFSKNRLPSVDRMLICDIDNTLTGDKEGLKELLRKVRLANGHVGLGIATGRRLESALKIIKEWNIPMPDMLITAVGTEIHYGYSHNMIEDNGWQRQIDYRWQPNALMKAASKTPGLKLQAKSEQRTYKISYDIDPDKFPGKRELNRRLRKLDLHAKLVYSHGAYLDILPVRASKGLAVRYLSMKWGIPAERFLVAGDSGNDEEMLSGNTLGVVVGNYSPELEPLRGKPRIFFANNHYARGVIEGIEYYDFLGKLRIPEDTTKKEY